MNKVIINFTLPESWLELGNKQLRKLYELIASDFNADEIKTLCLLRWSGTKVIGRQESGSYLLKRGKILCRESNIERMLSDSYRHAYRLTGI